MNTLQNLLDKVQSEFNNQLFYVRKCVNQLLNDQTPDFDDLGYKVYIHNGKVRITDVDERNFLQVELLVLDHINGMIAEDMRYTEE